VRALQIGDMWKGPKPSSAWILSPFYDAGKQASATSAAFANLLTTRGARELVFFAPGDRLPDGTIQIDISSAFRESSHPSISHHFSYVPARTSDVEASRPLHAKSVWLQSDGRALCMVGSSNFTAAGLGLHGKHNIELNVAYLVKDIGSRFGKACGQSWPPGIELGNPIAAKFLGGEIDSAGSESAVVLSRAFGLALFYLDTTGARLELEIGAKAPSAFAICSNDDDPLVNSEEWANNGMQSTVSIPWVKQRPPSSLRVSWQDEEGQRCDALWIVNVADASALPPPDELGSLSLAELLEVLTSARPVHEVVTRMLERREKKNAKGLAGHTDPHKKVDTSQFLLARMRRVARALEGMRERLQQPVSSMEALRWRLNGPIGPNVLAKRLAGRS
jgi:hypothetical protein